MEQYDVYEKNNYETREKGEHRLKLTNTDNFRVYRSDMDTQVKKNQGTASSSC